MTYLKVLHLTSRICNKVPWDISYVGPATSSLCRQPHFWHPSDADKDGRTCTLGRWSARLERTSSWHSSCTQPGHF